MLLKTKLEKCDNNNNNLFIFNKKKKKKTEITHTTVSSQVRTRVKVSRLAISALLDVLGLTNRYKRITET